MVKCGLIVCSKVLFCKFQVVYGEICKRGLVMGVFGFLEISKDDSTCLVSLYMFWMLGLCEIGALFMKKMRFFVFLCHRGCWALASVC